MPYLNRLEVIGNVGSTAEMRFSSTGQPVTNFSLAYNHKFQKGGEPQEETDWFSVVVWGKLAEVCNRFIFKGMKVYVAGRVTLHQWENAKGETKSRQEIQTNRVIFLSRPLIKVGENIENEGPEELPF